MEFSLDNLNSAQEQIDDGESAISGQRLLICELQEERKEAVRAMRMLDTLLLAFQHRRDIHEDIVRTLAG